MTAVCLGSGEIVINPGLKRIATAGVAPLPSRERYPVLTRWRTMRSLTRTVRHRSPMRFRRRYSCNRFAAAALRGVTSGGSTLGNAFPPVSVASLV
jgi:hypothetical protein